MALVRLESPAPFNFRNPDEWTRWKWRFDQFRTASGLINDDAPKQTSTLLYCLGEGAESVLSSMGDTDGERKDYNKVIAKLDSFFKVRRNIIFE